MPSISASIFTCCCGLTANHSIWVIGLGKRLFNHDADARNTTLTTHKLNVIRVIRKNGGNVSYALPYFCDDEAEAHAFEVKLISSIGRHDLKKGPLTNQTAGGEGVTGLSAETMARKAANLGGASDDPHRRVANEFFHSIAGRQDSVPIKPLGVRSSSQQCRIQCPENQNKEWQRRL
jgi:hypothetical protein